MLSPAMRAEGFVVIRDGDKKADNQEPGRRGSETAIREQGLE